MEELLRLRTSRRGYRAHMTKLLSGIADDAHADKLTVPLTVEQLERKQTILEDLDAKIAPLIDNETDLEAEIIEAEETRMKILDGMGRLKFQMNCPRTESTKPPPVLTNLTSAPLAASSDPPSSSTSTSHTVSLTTSHTAHLSDDGHSTLETAAHDPIHSEARTNPSTEHTPVISSSSYATSRLPKLSIPTFTGNPLTWQSFWDCFDSAVNSNPVLSNIQKLSYLRAQLQGDASRVVAGFPLTNASYSQSVELLKNRYGQPHKLVNTHLQALLNLPNPSNTLVSLQLFHDSVEGHIRSLTSLGKSTDSYTDLLVSVLLEKLPGETRKHLARECTDSDWILSELQDAIFKEIRVFESGLHMAPESSHTPTASFYTGTGKVSQSPHPANHKHYQEENLHIL